MPRKILITLILILGLSASDQVARAASSTAELARYLADSDLVFLGKVDEAAMMASSSEVRLDADVDVVIRGSSEFQNHPLSIFSRTGTSCIVGRPGIFFASIDRSNPRRYVGNCVAALLTTDLCKHDPCVMLSGGGMTHLSTIWREMNLAIRNKRFFFTLDSQPTVAYPNDAPFESGANRTNAIQLFPHPGR